MHPKHFFVLALVTLLASACGKAPTEVVSVQSPTPVPPSTVDVAGTWTGTMTYFTQSERVTVSIEQDGTSVHATWSTTGRGEGRFDGAFLGNRAKPDLAGTVTFSHPLHCETGSIKVGGEPTPLSMTLKGSGLWCFDPVEFRLELLKSVSR